MEIARRVLEGDRRALARLISMIEDSDTDAVEALAILHRSAGAAHVIGVTGPPGAGKSTLVDRLAKSYRQLNKKIGIIAVDPSSPFTGGAILGDRIRMSDLATDPGVFIRSMGTRGHLGGLARSTGDVVKAMDAFGMDKIIVETVGAGQSEIEIASHAHTTILVEMPGLGDDVQTIKAGIMEIGDIFVVNKADRQGADRTAAEISAMLELNPDKPAWSPPVLRTVASSNEGIAELRVAVEAHHGFLRSSGRMDAISRARARDEFLQILSGMLAEDVIERRVGRDGLERLATEMAARRTDPYTEARKCLEGLRKV